VVETLCFISSSLNPNGAAAYGTVGLTHQPEDVQR
jgi:hypothetical protein